MKRVLLLIVSCLLVGCAGPNTVIVKNCKAYRACEKCLECEPVTIDDVAPHRPYMHEGMGSRH